ncbi:MAG: 50S ribosomal protein L3 [Eubacteriales bacterium]|nr:50S ribosomal protein L3 [Clostridiales bacterium]MDD2442106.1 50S ribosomal protein L3 [Eubacteriales bacterium]MDD4139335.1 50S ribosomal protein L3 [Eubacteriales bacterium]MDD4745020.1 50S ribosomal protein L3 [Eubacteriales bacterium]
MAKFMLGRKAGMTQLFDENGLAIPATVIDCGPVVVVQSKNLETDGYQAVKVGYGAVRAKKVTRPLKGQYDKAGVEPRKFMREFKTGETFETGQEIKVSDMFQAGDQVDISGVSKGKGYAGTIKRYGQKGGPDSHGSMYHRRVGSMGPNTDPARVFKGKKMPGQMGGANVTVQNLKVVISDGERNILVVRGAVPGPKGGLVEISTSVKAR